MDSTRPVVVAVLDSGINPYHRAFELAAGPGWLPFTTGDHGKLEPLRTVELSKGHSWGELVRNDSEVWGSLQFRQLHYFAKTRALAISFFDWSTNPNVILDDFGHGTEVASTLLQSFPDLLFVMVEVSGALCSPDERTCVIDPQMIEAMEWAATQPWIDVISLSLGVPGSAPEPTFLDFARATEQAVAAGKVVVTAAGNEPSPDYADPFSGPPWITSVGGAVNSTRGDVLLASRTPDVVAEFVTRAALHDSVDGEVESMGTSHSAPRVAGLLAKSIAEVRRAWGHSGGIVDGALAVGPNSERLTNGDLRRALNASARYWNATDWDPTKAPSWDPFILAYSTTGPVGPAPYAQVGWGFVDNLTASEITRRVLAQDFDVPPDKAEAAAFMARGYEAREAYWRAVLG